MSETPQRVAHRFHTFALRSACKSTQETIDPSRFFAVPKHNEHAPACERKGIPQGMIFRCAVPRLREHRERMTKIKNSAALDASSIVVFSFGHARA
jgi:hypothetical protein